MGTAGRHKCPKSEILESVLFTVIVVARILAFVHQFTKLHLQRAIEKGQMTLARVVGCVTGEEL